jgi:hypothetical protein
MQKCREAEMNLCIEIVDLLRKYFSPEKEGNIEM